MQDPTVQELEARLRATADGTPEHVDALNALAWEVWSRDLDYAADIIQRAYDESHAIGYERGLAFARRGKGLLAYGRGDVEGGIGEINDALDWFAEHGDTEGEAQASTGLAYIHWGLGDFRRGFDLAERALRLYREDNDLDGQGWVLSALGGFYHDWNDHAKSLESYQRAHNFFLETDNVIGQARALNGIGNVHHILGEYDAALAYQDKSFELHHEAGNEFGEGKTLNDVGLILQSMGKYEESIGYHRRSLAIREERGYLQGSSTCLLDLANAHLALGDHGEAERMLTRALAESETIKSKPKICRAHEAFSRLYRATGDFERALDHYEKYHRLTEDVFNESFEQKLKNLRATHEIEASEREAELERLRNVELNEKNVQLEETLRELRGAQAQLLQDGKMAALGSLVAGLVHEVNTPVGAIRSSTDTALRAIERLYADIDGAPDNDATRRRRDLIDLLHLNANNTLESAGRLGRIAASLKNFARLDEAAFQRIDMHEGIDSALTLIGPELGDDVRVTRDYGELPRVYAYPSELNQVFMNLLLNASQALRGGGTVAVRTWTDDGHVHVEVADDGPGIAPEKLAHLFEPGFTTRDGMVRMRTGLYTSYNIVRNHHGTLTVESTPGQGSTFLVRLPMDLEKRIGGRAPV